ncbi:hypothetical protein RFH42_16620 [Acinetobacter rudis]|uniref:hypothetical protein n=1 Tax=Acinetobacter rudis TaxID=632955 RepID=UPI00280CAB39|nr:hypothetical protein [Acinetobacter rudis]MDQ8954575.1 hypothetical protein [Acinetobacter rudis]
MDDVVEYKDSRVVVEINGEIQYSCFDKDGGRGGVASLDTNVLKHVEAQLQESLLHIKELINPK